MSIDAVTSRQLYAADDVMSVISANAKAAELVPLTVISHTDFQIANWQTQNLLKDALLSHGIVGIRAVPGYKEKVHAFVQSLKQFHALPEETKRKYAPTNAIHEPTGEYDFLGYEIGKEQFKRPGGSWVVDKLKTSFYGKVPAAPYNKSPSEVDLESRFQEIGHLMQEVGEAMMEMIGLTGGNSPISLDSSHVGRMLYYSKRANERASGEAPPDVDADCPLWCGAHFDHGIFTALLPAVYFDPAGNQIPEPEEAGLFVRISDEGDFKKVAADDPDVMLFQVGEFGQLATNDGIRATEHRVHEARDSIERYTMALFFAAKPECVVTSKSVKAKDSRYGTEASCDYNRWHTQSLARYKVSY
jgi:isopenicillin N synthase-like dioxygenase